MTVVKRPKVNGVYYVKDVDLKINAKPGNGHVVIVTNINRLSRTAKVKTITSLESKFYNRVTGKHEWRFKNHKLADVRDGKILVVPKKQFDSTVLSGVNDKAIKVKLSALHYKKLGNNTRFPKKYSSLIKK